MNTPKYQVPKTTFAGIDAAEVSCKPWVEELESVLRKARSLRLLHDSELDPVAKEWLRNVTDLLEEMVDRERSSSTNAHERPHAQ